MAVLNVFFSNSVDLGRSYDRPKIERLVFRDTVCLLFRTHMCIDVGLSLNVGCVRDCANKAEELNAPDVTSVKTDERDLWIAYCAFHLADYKRALQVRVT